MVAVTKLRGVVGFTAAAQVGSVFQHFSAGVQTSVEVSSAKGKTGELFRYRKGLHPYSSMVVCLI